MSDPAKTRRRLWDSLEMHTIRRDFILTGVTVALVMILQACSARGSYDDSWILAVITSALVLLPFWIFYICRTLCIFRKPESYIFCRCQLSSVHQRIFSRGAMYFTVLIEDPEGGRFVADTHAIFAAYGIMGPLVEDYINRTVTVAYNRETEMVVVIG